MQAKDKHYVKSEQTPIPRVSEDRKPTVKLTNGNVELPKNAEKNEIMYDEAPKPAADVGPTPRDAPGDDPSANGQKIGTVIPNRIFVGGFSVKTADEDLWRFFSTISNITAAKIIYDRSGLSKCYGFVTFTNPRDAKYIVKQTGGVMFSPMGRLRISQAVRKQMPHYPSPPSEYNNSANGHGPTQQEGGYTYYNHQNHQPHNPKSSVCIGYPMQAVQHHHIPTGPHVSHGHTAPPVHCVTTQSNAIQNINHPPIQIQSRSAPSTSPRSSTGNSSESGIHSNQSYMTGYPEHVYPGTMIQAPQAYMYPSMMYAAPTLPSYDATGLYTTCPGYTQQMPTYQYVMVQPQPRDGTAAYATPYGHQIAYIPPAQSSTCYVRNDPTGKIQPPPPPHYPVLNKYIY